jgi:iron uptake system EfeUOB component EfeO/EfeM
MLQQRFTARTRSVLVAFAVVVAAGAILVAIRGGSASASGSASPATTASSSDGPGGSPALARYFEQSPHVTSALRAYALQGTVRGAPQTPPDELRPLAASVFNAPVAAYRAYSGQQLDLMQTQISRLQSALAGSSRAAAEDAWRSAFGDYLRLGAVYLEGQISTLDQRIDGTAGGLPGGTASPQFSGLHRIEFGLWTGAPLASLEPWAKQLATDVAQLQRVLPHVQIVPLDYATRAHEILEDAVRDLLSGTDVPWSGAGVLGTESGLIATDEVIKTLTPLLKYRETVLPVVNQELGELQSTLTSLKTEHGGSLPSNSQLTTIQHEQLDASIGQALEALAQVPGALETAYSSQIPSIPKSAVRIVP